MLITKILFIIHPIHDSILNSNLVKFLREPLLIINTYENVILRKLPWNWRAGKYNKVLSSHKSKSVMSNKIGTMIQGFLVKEIFTCS